MSETVLLGRGRALTAIPRTEWEAHLSAVPEHTAKRLRFMSDAHHRVRNFTVTELARGGEAITAEDIARKLELTVANTTDILNDLERGLFFLVRSQAGAVTWAYPVTIEETPHRLVFSTGERLYAA